MTSPHFWIASCIGFLILVGYGVFLRQDEVSLSHEHELQQHIQKGREDMRYSLKKDIDRLQSLTSDITADLAKEDAMFKYLQESLRNIETKLTGAEELQAAVTDLRKEYGDLKDEILKHTELSK